LAWRSKPSSWACRGPRYEAFLLLIGSVFVPLFGVLAADYFVIRRGYVLGELLRPDGLYASHHGVNWLGVTAWGLGVLAYLGITGKLAGLGLPGWPAAGASLPSLAVAFAAYWVLVRGAPRALEASTPA